MAIEDVLVIGILLFSVALTGFVGLYMSTAIMDKVRMNDIISNDPVANESLRSVATRTPPFYDYAFFIIFIGLIIGAFIASWFIAGNALFTWVFIFILGMFIALTPVLSNAFSEFSSKPEFSTTLSQLPIMAHIMYYLPLYCVMAGILIAVILFGKPFISGGEFGR